MKKEINLAGTQVVEKIMRKLRREQKMQKKEKQLRNARRRARRDMLALCLGMMGSSVVFMSSCTAVKKAESRSTRDSSVVHTAGQTLSERRKELFETLFESLSWQEDRQTALIRSDSSITLRPDGILQMQEGAVLLSSSRRQESASRSEQQQEDHQSRTQRAQQQEQVHLSENRRDLEKKRPPGAMLLLPALMMVFAFLVLIRKVRN